MFVNFFSSPGGTPFRQTTDSREANDTASFIANALKKKFAKVQKHSKENESFSSPGDRSNSWSPIADNNPTPVGNFHQNCSEADINLLNFP